MKYKDEIKGFLLAPLIPSGIFAFIATGAGLISSLGVEGKTDPLVYLYGGLIWFVSALSVAYVVVITFGIPGFVFYRKKAITGLNSYLLGGALLGLFSPALLLLILEWSAFIELGWLLFAISTCFGVITSYSFWRMVVKKPN